MDQPYRDRRKIDPSRGDRLGDGSPNDGDRVEIGPTALAFAEWDAARLALPDLDRMRRFRWERLTAAVVERGLAGLLVFDPLNIRYATDSTNMQLWNAHNPFRAVLLAADGYMVIWDYRQAMFLSRFNPLVREQRTGADLFYFDQGDGLADAARAFAAEVADLLRAHAPDETRLAVDKPTLPALRALEAAGLTVVEGEELTERTRAIKGPDEIAAMRCAVHSCEAAVAGMQAALAPGMTENDLWAELHAGNIRRGGEWIETRLLASGPRTNPWFQECGPRIIGTDEIVAFDTDLIGCYGMCVDMSRTWWTGPGRPPGETVAAMRIARDHIAHNMALLRPGLMIPDLIAQAHVLPDLYQRQKYGCLAHGVGLCDEWPLVSYPDGAAAGGFDHPLEAGMMLCVEALVSPEGGTFSIKLEEQVLITVDGHERLTGYPLDPVLLGEG